MAQNLCNDKVHGGKLLWSLTYAFVLRSCIDEILEDQYNFHPHSRYLAIYDVGDAYSKHVVSAPLGLLVMSCGIQRTLIYLFLNTGSIIGLELRIAVGRRWI